MRLLAILALASACSYAPTPAGVGDDDSGNGDDGGGTDAPVTPRDIPHLPSSQETPGTGALTFADGTRIDTDQLAVLGSNVPPGVEIVASGQDPAGPEVALIRAASVVLPANVTVRAFGSRPLVILADTIVIEGTLDGGGIANQPGPGGGVFTMISATAGTGGSGVHTSSFNDGGGGGGGHRGAGGSGGRGSVDSSPGACTPLAAAGSGGLAIGTDTIDVLRGGSAGGQGSAVACVKTAPGAGGGAIQLSAITSIKLGANAALNVGGGGGRGGDNCGGSDTGAGSGGGAGGALFLDAPKIDRSGALGANGGGGGGGASEPGNDGEPGSNATATLTAASGGNNGGSFGANGGAGGTGSVDPQPGIDNGCQGNGGGGGGAVGAIVLHVPASSAIAGAGLASPTPLIVVY